MHPIEDYEALKEHNARLEAELAKFKEPKMSMPRDWPRIIACSIIGISTIILLTLVVLRKRGLYWAHVTPVECVNITGPTAYYPTANWDLTIISSSRIYWSEKMHNWDWSEEDKLKSFMQKWKLPVCNNSPYQVRYETHDYRENVILMMK